MLPFECGPVQMFAPCVISPNRLTIKNSSKKKNLKHLLMLCYIWDQDANTNPLPQAWIGCWFFKFFCVFVVLCCFPLSLSYPVNSLNSHMHITCFIGTSILGWQDSTNCAKVLNCVQSPGTYTVGEENQLPEAVLWPLHPHSVIQMQSPPPADI